MAIKDTIADSALNSQATNDLGLTHANGADIQVNKAESVSTIESDDRSFYSADALRQANQEVGADADEDDDGADASGEGQQKQIIVTSRPHQRVIFRVYDEKDATGNYKYIAPALLLQDPEDALSKDVYFVHPQQKIVAEEVAGAELLYVMLYVCVTLQGRLFVTYVKRTGTEGNDLAARWAGSLRTILAQAMSTWVRIPKKKPKDTEYKAKTYRKLYGNRQPKPITQTLEEILAIAFEGRLIDKPDHHVLLACGD
jgi:hypothetical protein